MFLNVSSVNRQKTFHLYHIVTEKINPSCLGINSWDFIDYSIFTNENSVMPIL